MSFILIPHSANDLNQNFKRVLDEIREYAGTDSVRELEQLILPGDDVLTEMPGLLQKAAGVLVPIFDDALLEAQLALKHDLLDSSLKLAIETKRPVILAKINNTSANSLFRKYPQLEDADFIIVDDATSSDTSLRLASLMGIEASSHKTDNRARLTSGIRKSLQGDLSQVASSGQVNDIFISYSREDKDQIKRLDGGIEASGFSTWVDWEDIALTAPWLDEIFAGIESANSFLIAISPWSMRSPICHLEINHAIESKRRILPVVISPVSDIESELEGLRERYDANTSLHSLISRRDFVEMARENWRVIASLNWVFFDKFFDFDKNLDVLKRALLVNLDYLRQHARYENLVKEWIRREQNASLLLRGDELKTALRWFDANSSATPAPTVEMRRFFNASQSAALRQRNQNLVLGAITAFVLVIIGVIAVVQFQQRLTEEARSQSLFITDFAQDALSQGNARLGLTLALEAYHINADSPQLQRVMVEAALSPMLTASFDVGGQHPMLSALALSADGSQFFTGGSDQSVIRWDAQGLIPLQRYISAGAGISHLLYIDETETLIAGTDRGTIVVWRGEETMPLTIIQMEDVNSIQAFALSPDSSRLGVSFDNGMLSVFNTETMELLWDENSYFRRLGFGFDTRVSAVALHFNEDGSRLIAGVTDGTIGVWEANEGHLLSESQIRRDAIYSMVIFQESNEGIASFFSDGWTRFNWETGEVLEEVFDTDMNGMGLVGRGTVVVGESMSLYDSRDMSLLYDLPLQTSFFPRFAIARNKPDELYVYSASTTASEIQRFNVQMGLIDASTSFNQSVTEAAISPDGRQIVLASERASLMLYDLQTGRFDYFFDVFSGAGTGITGMRYTHDNQKLFVSLDETEAFLYDLTTGDRPTTFNADGFTSIRDVLPSPQGNVVLFTSSSSERSFLWDIASVQALEPQPVYTDARPVLFSDDGSLLMVNRDGNFIVYETASENELGRILFNGNNGDISDDNRLAIAAGSSIISWEINNPSNSKRIDNIGAVVSYVAIIKNGPLAIASLGNGDVLLLDLDTENILYQQGIHDAEILAMSYDPQRDAYVTVAADGDVVWLSPPDSYEEILEAISSYSLTGLNCQQIEIYNINRDCNSPAPYAHSLQPGTIAPAPELNRDETDTASSEADGVTSLVDELLNAEIPFPINVPVTDTLVPDYYFTEVYDPAEIDIIDVASLMAPGGFTVVISYDYLPNGSRFDVYLSESPYRSLDEWQNTSSGVLSALNQRFSVGETEVAFLLVNGSIYWSFIHDGTFVSGNNFSSDFEIRDLAIWIANYVGIDPARIDESQFTTLRASENLLEIGSIQLGESLDELDFTPVYPNVGDEYIISRQAIVSSIEGMDSELIEQVLGISGELLLIGYVEEDTPYGDSEFMIIEALSQYRNTREWWDSDFLIRSVMNLSTLPDGTEVISLSDNDGAAVYLLVDNYILFIIAAPNSRRSATEIIPFLLDDEVLNNPPEATPLPPLSLDQQNGLAILQADPVIASDLRGYIVDQPPPMRIDMSDVDNYVRMEDFIMPVRNSIISTTIEWGPGARDDRCGIRFRRDYNNSQNYYYVMIDRENTVHFNELLDGVWQGSQTRFTNAIRTERSEINTLRVVSIGNQSRVYVNDIFIEEFDTTDRLGWAGLIAGTYESSDESACIFDESWVWVITEE